MYWCKKIGGMAAVARTGTCAIVILRKMSRKPANKKLIRQEKLVVMVVKRFGPVCPIGPVY